jgi:hypothetical protein
VGSDILAGKWRRDSSLGVKAQWFAKNGQRRC